MRKFLYAAITFVVVVGAAAIYLYSSLDGIVRNALIESGSRAAGTQVSVDAVSLSLSQGKGVLSGVMIGNPPGFSTHPAITAGKVELTIDTSSVAANPVVIEAVVIDGPVIFDEPGQGGGNLDLLRRHAREAAEAAGDRPSNSQGRKVVIGHLLITHGQVERSGGVRTPLGDIELRDIGRSTGGATEPQVVAAVLDAVADAVAGVNP